MGSVAAGVAASHPATARTGVRILEAGGSAADAAVGAVLACCVAETIYTGLGGGGFATYFDAHTGQVTCLDFFVAVPGLDGDRKPEPMVAVDVFFGGLPQIYSIGGASVAVPGVPAGLGEVHRRWGRLPWRDVVAPAAGLARTGVLLPAAHARTLQSCAPALAFGEGAAPYQPGGRLLQSDELLFHDGLATAMDALASDGPGVFYGGEYADLLVATVRAAGGTLGPGDLGSYRVAEVAVDHATLAGYRVCARHDLNRTVDTIGALPADLSRPGRAAAVATALRNLGAQRLGDTTNVSVVDPDGNACVVTTTLGLGAGVWLPGLGINLNSMLGEGELLTEPLVPGQRMSSYMCPLVVIGPDDSLTVAAGSAGASRIRTALVDTLLGVLVDGLDVADAIARPRFHAVGDTIHAENGCPPAELATLREAGWHVVEWPELNHYFGGVTAVGQAGVAGDPRRGGVGLLL
ncbi:gamma-glutamyltranspeptidase [Actinoplanes sp. SE50]|uniref:gamma-glutamyltransferase n=1 Tax=unclassified Actinoplanes TaxID=2626549 RepID=UPI00023ED17A|nr:MULTISPECIES: gamma-glutamyltransferase [unclassified Actinoplanes]AEV81630.1 gamma-glutamyltranspeptidase [Actinoplanes sp. SE50/110]ATO80031.1 gamma-glutamyltranspeptidase [Actinoplanes sp. SE50]SLL97435.1 gamma-glutamyltranspeptidase [Actinoplanes sp. SE50/110]